ncbi:MAG: succinate dehydrogenase [Armatimonadetes bacterium]|nr:succinate dehydrogenase [Armatimonadota bacterium]
MALSITRENYVLHRLHSLSGVVPVGFYMLQHLTLNSFAFAGPEKFNSVVLFFDSMPKHFLLTLEICLIWLPLLFHAVYGTFIAFRAQTNVNAFPFSQNKMFVLQRVSGIFAFLFLIVHVITTTINAKINGVNVILFDAWHEKLTSTGYVWLIFYVLGVVACSYHLSYGIWNFCIRWGITISEQAQMRVQKFSAGMFVVVSLIGIVALLGFLRGTPGAPSTAEESGQPTNTSIVLPFSAPTV